MSNPLVSVLIITYNHEKYIRDAINGCLDQKSNFSYEIIIHDDASTDGTGEIVKEYAEKYPDLIIPIIQTENQYSKGFKFIPEILVPMAKGKYIAFCEGDDYWCDPNKLQKQVEIMENDSSISLCFTATKWIYEDGSKKNKVMRYFKKNHYLSSSEVILAGGGVTDIVSTVIRKDIFTFIPHWYNLSPVGDAAIYLLSLVKGVFFYLNDITAVYRSGVRNSWTEKNKTSVENEVNYKLKLINMKDNFNKYTDGKFSSHIHKRINFDIIDLSFIYKDLRDFKTNFYPRLNFFEKIEYTIFKKFKSRLLWHKYRKLLRILGLII